MGMKKLIEKLEYLIADYSVDTDEIHGEMFNSLHEAWGVADEEFVEALEDLTEEGVGIADLYAEFKRNVMKDDYRRTSITCEKLSTKLVYFLAEMVEFTYCIDKARMTAEYILEVQNDKA